MNRRGRLQSARSWLPTYSGKNVLKGYCKHFAVDWRCAAVELAMLGVEIDPAYLAMRETTEAEKARKRKEREQQQEAEEAAPWHPYTDPLAAYLDDEYEALYDLELQQSVVDDYRTDPPL
ncbi:hypothetical protein [Stieleria mannarensis]|uniref:hypothetical protein n=1 Tax=Stieleria mannarensis TaxID=2755585 RepID=UPI001603F093|nr:hypothetical protein [Rhodopirellula sp. JC639]